MGKWNSLPHWIIYFLNTQHWLQIISVTSLLCVCYDWSYYKLEHNKFCQVKQIRKTEEIFHTCAECRLGWGPVTAGCRLLLPLFSGHWLLTIFCLLTINFNTSHSMVNCVFPCWPLYADEVLTGDLPARVTLLTIFMISATHSVTLHLIMHRARGREGVIMLLCSV